MSEDTPAQDQAMGQPAAMVEHQKPYQQLHHDMTPAADAPAQQQQEFAQAPYQHHAMAHAMYHKGSSAVQPQHDMAQHHSMQQQAQPSRHAAGMWCTGPMLHPYGPAQGWHGAAGQHSAPPAAFSRMSFAGDAVADAQRQSDQCMAPATAGLPAQQHVAWAMQRAAAQAVGCAGQRDLDAAKLTAQVDQHTQGQQAQALSVEPVVPPNLKRLRTSAVDKLKQSGAPGEDLSTFIPTPTWGSPRVGELQPAAVGAGNSTGGNRSGPGGLAGRAAHAASLLAQAAANCAARSNTIAAAAAAEDASAHDEHRAQGEDSIPAAGSSRGLERRGGSQSRDARDAADTAAAGARRERVVGGDTQPVPHLASLLRQQRSDDELAAQYRLELQQLKAEHAALQMLTQHAEQETRPRAMVANEVVLPTPGMPRSLEGEAERLAAKMLKQAGGDWKASMSAMMDLLRSNMQQGSQLLSRCTKAQQQPPQPGSVPDAATAAAAAERHTWGARGTAPAGDEDAAVAGSGDEEEEEDPAVAEAAMEEDGNEPEQQGGDEHMQDWAGAAAPAGHEGPEGHKQQQYDAQGREQQLQDADAPAGRQLRRRRQHWLTCSDQEDTASQSSSHPEPLPSAAAAAAAAGASGDYHAPDPDAVPKGMQRSVRSCRKQAAAAVHPSAAVHGSPAAAEAAAALYSEQVPAAGSRHGSPMRSAYADNGYDSPAASTAVGPSPFTAAGAGPGGTPSTVGGGMMRTRTLTRRQSRLAPKPAPSGVADTEAAAFEAAIAAAAAAAAAGASAEPTHADAPLAQQASAQAAAAADPGSSRPQGLGCVLRSRARKSPPATTPTPGRMSARLGAASTADAAAGQHAAMQGHALQFAPAGAFAGGGPAGGMQQHSPHILPADDRATGNPEQGSPRSAPAAAGAVGSAGVGAGTVPAATFGPGGQTGYTCSAAAAAAAFALGAEWGPGWGAAQHSMQQEHTQHSMPQQAPARAAGGGVGPKPQGLTVDTDCGGLDEQDWMCLGLLDTPGPAAAAAAAAAAAGGGSGPSGITQGVANAAAGGGSTRATAGADSHLNQQQQLELARQQHQMACQQQQVPQQMHMQYHELAGMHPHMLQGQHGAQHMQMHMQGGMGPGYWMGAAPMGVDMDPTCAGHMQAQQQQHAGFMPAGDAGQSQALPGMLPEQQMQAGGGYGHMHWQQMHGGPHAMTAGVSAVGMQGAGTEGHMSPEAAEAALAALLGASNMQDVQQGQHMLQQQQHMGLQLQQQQYAPQQQQMMYHSQQQMGAAQQQQQVVPAGSTPAATATVADQELFNMLIGWSK